MKISENRLIDSLTQTLYSRIMIYRQQCALSKKLFHQEITNNKLKSQDSKEESKFKTYLPIMDYFNEGLTFEERLIFFNEIWNVNPNKKWYEEYFSKTTYYKYLHSVLDSLCIFLND
ncbi:hypothetical protein [Mycoplasma zalophi]|uniref:Uncharacterized protein n=1 Tax=Mycoplasma zalophi TaxID=191287 RepID=A0ABS6DQ51_9MOLU|nr:hypothetical protein [Mycoplasma zalophi]MBU4690735.1 hypothetical protein [Mycoplasma zalophi]MBU4692449.1 hypothetical protein [Mycoplasma zalophi]